MGEGGGYTFASMPINKQQLIIVSIKATILNTIQDEQIICPTFNVHPMTKWCVLCLILLCFFLFVVSWEIHCTTKGNVVQTLNKASRALAFFPLACRDGAFYPSWQWEKITLLITH